MILGIDTSTPVCRVYVERNGDVQVYEWDIGRGLADGILKYIRDRLAENGGSWNELTGLVAYRGPGSFTGLRIGLTVFNTIADTMNIPIVGESGDDWFARSLERLHRGENDELVMPLYGREPNITKPRK